ncbi:hypothetical protein OBBRIDRAFT_428584 [Obba rivulosa]|uniref:Uncharacterized protein n=1 Tax=Obba rivulosa TaxID=1052685 RepID=A0A8E2B208_9APHY|nr:hypothetical protein OBBRIDRAFT_428584 [Obba rivulosa]
MRFIAFSHRTSSGRLTRGRTYVASSAVVESWVDLSVFESADIQDAAGALSQTVADAHSSFTDPDSDFEEDVDAEEDRKLKRPRKIRSMKYKEASAEPAFIVRMVSSHVEGATREEFIDEFAGETPNVPRSCSCKSMYRVAVKASRKLRRWNWTFCRSYGCGSKSKRASENPREIYDNGNDHAKSSLLGLLGDTQLPRKRRRVA